MKIGVDITPLQGPHRMRGVGHTLVNCINHLSKIDKQNNSFVFYVNPLSKQVDPFENLNLDDISYEVQEVIPTKKYAYNLSGKLSVLNSIMNFFKSKVNLLFGDSRVHDLKDVDWFFQFDQNKPLPTKWKVKSLLIVYDLIPYVMESDYLWSYGTARKKGCSRKGALRHQLYRNEYLAIIRKNVKRANMVIAISEHTKQDLIKYLGIKPSKINVSLLGVDNIEKTAVHKKPGFQQYVYTSWGYVLRDVDIESKKFLLFVGGADQRRKLSDLVAAFNNLRARGENIKLVLAGDTMLGAFKVPNVELQKYLKNTSYLDDIYFLGYINEDQKAWLYQEAILFVYPSIYEGFGLPILEAMQYGTPVVTYKNSSIPEVAGDAAIYAEDHLSIANSIKQLIEDPRLKDKYSKLGKAQAEKFSWQKTSENIISSILATTKT